ncbi:unnamed protein product, partial [Discosporangium mesarthrocarpum]
RGLPPGLAGILSRRRVAAAAAAGRVEVLEWLRDLGDGLPTSPLEYSPLAVAEAAGAGHVHVLQWLLDNGTPVGNPPQRRWRFPVPGG